MKYEDFNWNIEKEAKFLIEHADKTIPNRDWTIEVLYWQDKDNLLEVRSGIPFSNKADVFYLFHGEIKHKVEEAPKVILAKMN